jgi:hypothetical protein
MSTLTDFLKEQAARQREQSARYADRRKEWVESVERLIGQLRKWIEEADVEGALRVSARQREVWEEEVGRYTVTDLLLDLAGYEVLIAPLARQTVGTLRVGGKEVRSQGRVDLTNTARTLYLYRVVDEGGERWFLVEDPDREATPLDRAAFEEALLRLLR